MVAAITVVTIAPLAGVPSVMAAATSVASHEQATSFAEPTIPRLGYAAPSAVDPSLLRDLATALDTYAGKSGPVFDMTNAPGYIYYLLDRSPSSRFVNIALAMTPYAQDLLIGELRRSRPPVVIFDSTTTGLPIWDGIPNNVRDFDVSQYVLSNWTPILQTHGELLLLRSDLIARRPPIPRLIVPPVSANLWFSGPACDWGSIPNFLSSPASGSSVEMPVTAQGPRVVSYIRGWAVDTAARAPTRLLVLASGHRVLGTARPGVQRPDLVGAVGKYRRYSGFSAEMVRPPGDGPITVYWLTADGILHPLAGQQSPLLSGVLRLPDGTNARVGAPIQGRVEVATSKTETIGVAHIPASVTITDYGLLTLHAGGPLGPSDITISDVPGGSADQDIDAHALPPSRATLGVPVGSCLQWHGYRSHTLYVSQTTGAPIERLQLSGVG